MKENRTPRSFSPQRNDWYRRRSWLPDEPSPLALSVVTIETDDNWSDDGDDDSFSDDSTTALYGSLSEDSDSSDEDLSPEETARRRNERSPGPEPEGQGAEHDAISDELEIAAPTKSPGESNERHKTGSSRAESDDDKHYAQIIMMFTQGSHLNCEIGMTEAGKSPKGRGRKPESPARSSKRSSDTFHLNPSAASRTAKNETPKPKIIPNQPPKRWQPLRPGKSRVLEPGSSDGAKLSKTSKPLGSSNWDIERNSSEASSSQPNRSVSSSEDSKRALDEAIRLYSIKQARFSAEAVKALQVGTAQKAAAAQAAACQNLAKKLLRDKRSELHKLIGEEVIERRADMRESARRRNELH